MERAPLPPHERSWRHPSEIGPQRLDLDVDVHGRTMLLAAGTLAAVLLVVMIVALTPGPTAQPVAISQTTRPMTIDPAPAPQAAVSAMVLTANRAPRLASFSPIPNAIAAGPVARGNEATVAATLPARRELVRVKTEFVTYQVEWGDLDFLQFDTDAVVLNRDGEFVARIVDGAVEVLVGR